MIPHTVDRKRLFVYYVLSFRHNKNIKEIKKSRIGGQITVYFP